MFPEPGHFFSPPRVPGGAGGSLPYWDTSPGFVAEQYGAEFRPSTAVSAAIGGGTQLFAGGSEATVSTGTQAVDVSTAAEEIDAGTVTADLGAYLGGIDAEGDFASVSATFLDASGTRQTGAGLLLPPVTNGDRGYQTALLPRSTSGKVPSGTRQILVTITSTRIDGTCTDGYADNLSLTLASTATSTSVTGIRSLGRRVKGKVAASAPCKAGRKVVVKKGQKTVGSGRSSTKGSFNIKTKKHKKGKLTVSVRSKTVGSTYCASSTKKVPGRN